MLSEVIRQKFRGNRERATPEQEKLMFKNMRLK
jgi:hypothetical protein